MDKSRNQTSGGGISTGRGFYGADGWSSGGGGLLNDDGSIGDSWTKAYLEAAKHGLANEDCNSVYDTCGVSVRKGFSAFMS